MHVNPRFLTREKVEPILPMSEYRRTHQGNLPNVRSGYNQTIEANVSGERPLPTAHPGKRENCPQSPTNSVTETLGSGSSRPDG